MKLKVIATGSRANCYILEDGNRHLILDAGLPYQKLMQAVDHNYNAIDAVLIGHEHADHASAVPDMLANGLPVYMTEGTMNGILDDDDYLREMVNILPERHSWVDAKGWIFNSFQVEHDAEEPVGFLISRGEDRILYATDCSHINFGFSDLTAIIIECNYCLRLMNDNLREGRVNQSLKNRILATHMGLETLVPWLKLLDLSKVQMIVLVHLSNTNSDAYEMKRTIEYATGVTTVVATAGDCYNLSNPTDF